MKTKTLLFLILAALSLPVHAGPAANMCGEAQSLVSEVMDLRIEGYSAERVYSVGITGEESREFQDWFTNVVVTVYELDRHHLTGDERAALLGEFFSTCVRTAKGELF